MKQPQHQRDVAIRKFVQRKDFFGRPRLFAGLRHEEAAISLKDANGKDRLRLSVAPDGTQKIEFLAETGEVVRTIGAADAR